MATLDYLETALVDHVLRQTQMTTPASVWCALFTADPTDANLIAGEVGEASYGRQEVTFIAPTDGHTDNDAEIAFAQALTAWGNITHIGIYDASTVGNLLYHGSLSLAKDVGINDTFKIAIHDLDITLS